MLICCEYFSSNQNDLQHLQSWDLWHTTHLYKLANFLPFQFPQFYGRILEDLLLPKIASWTNRRRRLVILHTWSVFWWRSVNNKLRWVILTFIMLLKNCRLERKQQLLSRFVMPGVSFIDYTGTFVKHNAPMAFRKCILKAKQ